MFDLVPTTKNVIFIGEMTEKIGLSKEDVFLYATKQIASYLNANPGPSTTKNQLKFSIAFFGKNTIRPIKLQNFDDFISDLNSLIEDDSTPDAEQTREADIYILMDLYDTILSNPRQHFLVLFMGQNRIADISCADKYNKRLADSPAKIFVLDMTEGFLINAYLFKDLTKNDSTRIYNYDDQDVLEITSHYTTSEFARIWNGFDCPEYCVDVWNYCQGFVSSCQDPMSGSLIQSKCLCTCQVCGSPPTMIPSTTPSVTPTTSKSKFDPFLCRPINIMFVLDGSQFTHLGATVATFMKLIASAYPMKGEINGASSRIGIVLFSDSAIVVYHPIERTRREFLDTIDRNGFFFEGETKNISNGLETALQELSDQGITLYDDVMVILMTDSISTLDILQTKSAADKVRNVTKFFSGVGIDGIKGNQIAANLTNLQLLLGNKSHAFADIPHAEDSVTGIWPKSRKVYPCPKCKNVVFVGEMTAAIGQQKKEVFLNATKQIATHLNANPGELMNVDQLQFSIALYGNGTLRPIKLQAFADFNRELDILIDEVTNQNDPDSGQTRLNDILADLYELFKGRKMEDYLVLFMGESEKILDLETSSNIAIMLSEKTANIFVLDMTNDDRKNDYFFEGLVKNEFSRIYKYSNESVDELVSYYTTEEFDQVWDKMMCNFQVITDPLKCLPVNLIFVLDTSQSIDGTYFNTTVRAFVKQIAAAYPMKGEIKEPSSRIGIVQFASDANVTYPLIERTREQFLKNVDACVFYSNQGKKNISSGLDTAVDEFVKQNLHKNLMVVLMTDNISNLDIVQTQQAAHRVRNYTRFFAGVGIDGVNGNGIAANLRNLITFIGNHDLAFADVQHAEDPVNGTWPKTREFYPCPVKFCKGVIFIGEMTEVIAQYRKQIFLNATKGIAAYLNANPGLSTTTGQLQFSIATYGNGTLRPIKLQTFSDFNNDLDFLINDVTNNNQPNAGHTNTSSILNDLYSVITANQLANYLVLFMGETQRILDYHLTDINAQKLASTPAQIFVFDLTGGSWASDYIFKDLVKNDLTKIYNYTGQSVANVTNYYTKGKFNQIWKKMGCNSF